VKRSASRAAAAPAQRRIRLPHNGWRPRAYQMGAWRYMEQGGRHAELIWARRSGKDEICLHWAAIAAHQRPATYWHMLPEAAQARKAIWEAINPHTGVRRIDEAFPHELRATTREQEMLIKFKCGSTWQVVGSDNFNSLVGSPPAGVVFSEWALAQPAARAYQFANQAEAQAFAQQQAANAANNAARAQGLQEQTALRDLPLNELNALRASTQIQNPQFSSVPQAEMANTDISGDIYKSAEMQQQASNGFMSGLFGLGSSLLGAAGQAKGFPALFSDRRLKCDIVRVGTTPVLGLPLYAFSYVWDRGKRVIGVMADEVARVRPSAVVDHPSGFKAVDYGQIA